MFWVESIASPPGRSIAENGSTRLAPWMCPTEVAAQTPLEIMLK